MVYFQINILGLNKSKYEGLSILKEVSKLRVNAYGKERGRQKPLEIISFDLIKSCGEFPF